VIEEIKNIFGSGFIGDKFKDVQSQKLQKMLAERNDIMVENFDSAANQQGQRTVSLEPKLQKAQQPKKQGQQQPLKTTSLQPQPQPTAYNSRSVESPVPANFDDSFSHSHSRLADSRANNHLQP
jgi:biotin carboxyl carrier protein